MNIKTRNYIHRVENKIDNGLVVNAKYPPIGFVGITYDNQDNTSKIALLENFLLSRGGGTLYFPAGTFKANLTLQHSIHYIGDGKDATIIQPYTIGATIKFALNNPTTNNHNDNGSVQKIRIEGNVSDATSNGIECITSKGIGHWQFKELYITKCGNDGMHFEQTTNPYWAQYLTFEDVFIGAGQGDQANGCLNYGFYAIGGFSTNTFINMRIQSCKNGMFIGAGGGIIPESCLFTLCNIQDINVGSNSVCYGVNFQGVMDFELNHCYIEGIGESDTTHTSIAVNLNNSNNRCIKINGGIISAFHKGIVIDYAETIHINDVYFFWNGTVPTAIQSCIEIGTNIIVYKTWIGQCYYDTDIPTNNRIIDTGKRSVGYKFDGDGPYHPNIYLSNRRITSATTKPSSSGTAGDITFYASAGLGECVGWYCTGSTNWQSFGQSGYRTNAGTPVGAIIPRDIGEELFDSTNKNWYKATGITNADWKVLT